MVTTHIEKPEPNAIGAKVKDIIESGHEFYATAVTGQGGSRVRRPTLFLIAFVAIGLGSVWTPALLFALLAIAMLALTDSVA